MVRIPYRGHVVVRKQVTSCHFWMIMCVISVFYLMILSIPATLMTYDRMTLFDIEVTRQTSGLDNTDNIDYRHIRKPHYVINHPHVCDDIQNKKSLLVIVSSSPENLVARAAIRQTWASQSAVNGVQIKVLFFVAIPTNSAETSAMLKQEIVQLENQVHGDIIEDMFIDTYWNMTLKTLSAVQWADRHCPNVTYLMKTDDDVYLNFTIITNLLSNYSETGLYMGHCFNNSGTYRDRRHKWFVHKRVYPNDIYPPYCCGTGYIISNDLTKLILEQSKLLPYLFIEDAFIGIILNRLHVKPIALNDMFYTLATLRPPAKDREYCQFRNYALAHKLRPKYLHMLYHNDCSGRKKLGKSPLPNMRLE